LLGKLQTILELFSFYPLDFLNTGFFLFFGHFDCLLKEGVFLCLFELDLLLVCLGCRDGQAQCLVLLQLLVILSYANGCFRCGLLALLRGKVHGHCLIVHVCVAFEHKFFEREKVVDSEDLVNNFTVNWIASSFLTRQHELLFSHAQVTHQSFQQTFD
jgi:hypothetical protein